MSSTTMRPEEQVQFPSSGTSADKNGSAAVPRLLMRANSDPALQNLCLGTSKSQDISAILTPSSDPFTFSPADRIRYRRRSGTASIGQREPLHVQYNDGFFQVFGLLGIPMVIAFLFSAIALFGQAAIQVNPEAFANAIMNTESLDNGAFWLLPETEFRYMAGAIFVLALFGSCYLVLLVLMVFFRHKLLLPVRRKSMESFKSLRSSISYTRNSIVGLAAIHPNEKGDSRVFPKKIHAAKIYKATTNQTPEKQQQNERSITRRNSFFQVTMIEKFYAKLYPVDKGMYPYYMVAFDLPKLIFQSVTLVAYLRKGFPIPLIDFYATMLTFNWLISFYRFQRTTADHSLIITRLFYLFDLFFAVFAPMVVLTYAHHNFHFDRAEFKTREETIAPGLFDRTALLFANPKETSMFRQGFSHLVLNSSSTIGVKSGLLAISIFKWWKIIFHLIQVHHRSQRQTKIAHVTRKVPANVSNTKMQLQIRRHLLVGIVLFLCFGAMILSYTIVAVKSSTRNCLPYPNCVVVSYQWYEWESSCPCAVYVNRKADPRVYAKWINPPDATEELARVAEAGQLKTVQIINRALIALPESLQKCHHLEQLHIQGGFTGLSLRYLPNNLFHRMKNLRFIRIGNTPMLPRFPSLQGLHNLRVLAITGQHSLREFPSFDDLTNLGSLTIADAVHVPRLPSLHNLRELSIFSLTYRNEICCNGFLPIQKCNRSSFNCRKRENEPDVQCANDTISKSDWQLIITQTTGDICPNKTIELIDTSPTEYSSDTLCNGTLFRECRNKNTTGICFNGRMQVVYCDISGSIEKMRRLQIKRGVGIPCDLEAEAWLGFAHGDMSAYANNPTVHINFKKPDGSIQTVEAKTGMSILQVAHANDIDLEGACESSMACSTCHVILEDPVFETLEPACEDEEDMLDMAFGLTDTSRLGCQVIVDEGFEGTTVTLPKATRNFYVDGHVPKPH